MLSKMEKHSTSLKCWWTMPIPSAFASFGSLICTTWPSFLMTPSSGWYRPNSTLISVDFPAPFSPNSAWISPRFSWSVMLSFATIPGKRLVIFSISMAYGCSKLTALLLLYSVFIVLYLPEYFKEKMQEYQVCFVKFVQRQKKRTGLLPSSSCKDSDPYLMLPAKFTVMVVAGMAEMSLETVTSPSYMAFTRAL